MKILIYLTALCFGSWGLLAGLIEQPIGGDLFWGMFGPWLIGIVTVFFIQKAYINNPGKLTNLMIKSFFSKMLFYGLYVSYLVLTDTVSFIPFVISFTVYFVVLHVLEALYFQSIFKPEKL